MNRNEIMTSELFKYEETRKRRQSESKYEEFAKSVKASTAILRILPFASKSRLPGILEDVRLHQFRIAERLEQVASNQKILTKFIEESAA